MKKLNVAIIIFSFLFGLSSSFAGRLEQRVFDAPENEEYKIEILGFFKKPGVAHPSETMFEYLLVNKKFISIYSYTSYKFLGRTGEKTFEVEKEERDIGDKKENVKKLSMYFEKAGGLLELKIFSPIYTGCTKDYKIYLKMINLQANELQYQIILPQCLEGKK